MPRLQAPKGHFGGYWWLAHFCTFLHLQLFANQLLAKFCSARQIPNGTKTGQNHRKIKSRTLQARHPLSWTSLFCAKVQFCPVKNKQNPANMLPIKHLYYMCIFRKILQVLHAQTCVAYFKDLLKSVLCHLYTTVLPPMRIALEQCTTHLPLSAMRKYVFHQQIGKKCHMAQWPDKATYSALYNVLKLLIFNMINDYKSRIWLTDFTNQTIYICGQIRLTNQ